MSYIKLENICKKYDKSDAYSVDDFNLEIEKGEFIVFVGPSGCGKSTTLRMIAGLEKITSGDLKLDDIALNNIDPRDRNIAMVFQNYALYPHMTVYQNIAFGMKMRKESKEEIDKKVKWAAEVLGLTEYLSRKPSNLSGGQSQRVALGRAIVRNPKVFLMDEPLSNLDAKLRVTMRNEITSLHKKLAATTIYVTHDQMEAMTMADRIVILKDGIIQQIGTPVEVFQNPKNLFVATFIGTPQMNIVNVKINQDKLLFEDGQEITIPLGKLKVWNNPDGNYKLGLRPKAVSYDNIVMNANEDVKVKATIKNIENMGDYSLVHVIIAEQQLIYEIHGTLNKEVGDVIEVAFLLNKCLLFGEDDQVINHA